MSLIYHMAHQSDWDAAHGTGAYHGSADDVRDGFIHFSAGSLIAESAAKHRAGQADLRLICCEAEALGEALKWERSRNGIDFPTCIVRSTLLKRCGRFPCRWMTRACMFSLRI